MFRHLTIAIYLLVIFLFVPCEVSQGQDIGKRQMIPVIDGDFWQIAGNPDLGEASHHNHARDPMVLRQSASIAASLAIDQRIPVQQVDYPTLRKRLVAEKQRLQ